VDIVASISADAAGPADCRRDRPIAATGRLPPAYSRVESTGGSDLLVCL